MPMLLNPFWYADQNPSVLLCHFDGTQGSTVIVDVYNHTMTAQGSAFIDQSQFVFGSASVRMDGAGDYVDSPYSTDWNFNAGDFTIEFRVRFASVAVDYVMASQWGAAGARGWHIAWFAGNLRFSYSTDGSGQTDLDRVWAPSANTWYGLAFTRAGTALRLFINGTQQGSAFVVTDTIFPGTAGLFVGRLGGNASFDVNGWIDEMRIQKGNAAYTADYTLATEPFSS